MTNQIHYGELNTSVGKKKNVKAFSGRDFKGYRTPVHPESGNPLGACITSSAWCEKYHYSVEQLRSLCAKHCVFGFFREGIFYVLDLNPNDQCNLFNQNEDE